MNSDLILDQSLRCLLAHCHPEWGDRAPLDVFNRLLAKNIRPSGWTANTHLNITPQQIASRMERWTTEVLAKLHRGHGSTAGKDFHCPIVVAEYEGMLRMLDGNHRVNRWIEAKDTRLHEVHIHMVSGGGEFVELPAIIHRA